MIQCERITMRRYTGDGCWSYLHLVARREKGMIDLLCEVETGGRRVACWARSMKMTLLQSDETCPVVIAMDWVLLGNLYTGDPPMPGIEDEISWVAEALVDMLNYYQTAERLAKLTAALK